MKKITIKLILFFISIMFISSIMAFVVSTFFTDSIKKEIRVNQKAIASSVIQLAEKTDLSIDEIVDLTSTAMYDVEIIEDIILYGITENELNRVQNAEIVLLARSRFHGPTTIFMIDNSYIGVSLHPNNTIIKVVASRVWLGMFSYIFIGALLIIILGRRVVEPIIKLNYATQEVAKGNFDIHVENNCRDEVGQLTKNFNRMTRELKSIEYLRKDFISSVSHEFKTPLASIQGFAKLLQRGNITEEEKEEYTRIIVEESARLANLSSNILKLSKLENQEIVNKRLAFSLDEQMRKSILLLEHEWSNRGLELDIELEQVNYIGDEELLQQVWINLLNNAIKFSIDNSKIKIRLNNHGSFLRIEITDYGIGMSDETIDRIFEKFYQGDKAHSVDGNGLGLPLVKRILDLCGGNIKVKSSLNEGSTFIIELPVNNQDSFKPNN